MHSGTWATQRLRPELPKSMVVFKYTLDFLDRQSIEMPKFSKILSVDVQRGKIRMWAACDPDQDSREIRTFEVIGTGNEVLGLPRDFLGTVIIDPFVWHVFEQLGKPGYLRTT